jgi:hypothetical protein
MPIVSGMPNATKQLALDAIAPVASVVKFALIKVGATGTYDRSYATYVLGMGGDELPTAAGYTQGGITLTGRTEGPTDPNAWVDWNDPVWTAVGALSSIGGIMYDSSNSNRVIAIFDFGGTITATNGSFTVNLPGDGGVGTIRLG